MAQLGDAIARYHKFLERDRYRDLAWADQLQQQMRERQLTDGGRLLAPVLRPEFISRRQLDSLCRAAERLASIVDEIENLALGHPSLLSRLQMLPAEKMLAAVPRCYSRLSVTSRMDANLENGSLCLRGFDASKSTGFAQSEPLSDLFLDLRILKDFKRGCYKISKIGGAGRLVNAMLQVWKEFGGRGAPNVAILEAAQPFGCNGAEGRLLSELFERSGVPARIVTSDELEYAGGRLSASGFPIDIVFRRVLTREFLVHCDLSHPFLRAYRDRAICVVNDFRSEVAQRRVLFELLTDDSVIARLSADDRKLIHNFVPWTRLVTQRKTKYKDQDVDLPEFIRRGREQLVLRPNDHECDQRVFVGAQMTSPAWDRAVTLALRTPYVVQERFFCQPQLFPVYQYGELRMKPTEVSIHPHVFNGKVQGVSAALASSSGGCSTPLAIAPVLLLEPV
jgi:GAF domain-containing protein